MFYPTLGNHEFSGKGRTRIRLQDWWFAFPEGLKNRRWYSVALGSPGYLTCLSTATPILTPGTPAADVA